MMPNNSNIDEMIKYTQELYAKEKGNNYAEHFKKKHGGNFYREILTATALATNKKLSQKTETLYKEDFNDLVSLAATLLREKINIPDNLAIFLADFLEHKAVRPRKKRPVNNPISISDEDYFFLAHSLKKKFKIPLYSSEGENNTTAAHIVAQALNRSVETTTKSIKKINAHIRSEQSRGK